MRERIKIISTKKYSYLMILWETEGAWKSKDCKMQGGGKERQQ